MTSADVMSDPYRSRVIERWEIVVRPDPVVWPGENGPLTPAQVELYARSGYLVIETLFDPAELASLVEAAAALREAADPTEDDVVAEANTNVVRSVFRVHRDNGPFARLARDTRLAGVVRQLLGSDVYIHQSRINYKPGFDGKPFPWHSDFETWHVEDGMPKPRAISASVLLSDNDAHNGPLMVLPGSHLLYVRCEGETPENHFQASLVNQTYGVPTRAALVDLVDRAGIASATAPAGSVVFFDSNIMHGSGGNITPMPRNNVFMVYNSVENAVVDPFGRRPARPVFLAERDVAPLPR